jgi:hypothetical protein
MFPDFDITLSLLGLESTYTSDAQFFAQKIPPLALELDPELAPPLQNI